MNGLVSIVFNSYSAFVLFGRTKNGIKRKYRQLNDNQSIVGTDRIIIPDYSSFQKIVETLLDEVGILLRFLDIIMLGQADRQTIEHRASPFSNRVGDLLKVPVLVKDIDYLDNMFMSKKDFIFGPALLCFASGFHYAVRAL